MIIQAELRRKQSEYQIWESQRVHALHRYP